MRGPGGNAPAPVYLLDTNILLAYIRAGPLGEHVEASYTLMSQPYKPLICEVTIGEILALARRLGWGQRKLTTMGNLLRELVRIDISSQDVMEAYAEIDCFCFKNGRSVGKNDVWIAAAAKVASARLLTTDKDFISLFDAGIIRGNWVDPHAGRDQPG